jgi:flavorubredoxin
MWGSTDLMARAIAEGLREEDVTVRIMPLGASTRSDVATELLDAGALIVGSPTINNSLFPTLADVLSYLKGLKPKNLVGAAFGSYGWSGEAVPNIEKILKEMNVAVAAEAVAVNYVPDDNALTRCKELGQTISKRLPAAGEPCS